MVLEWDVSDRLHIDMEKGSLMESLFEPDASSWDVLNDISKQVIGAAFTVSNELSCGFLEKVYENALAYELRKRGINAVQQEPIRVLYSGVEVGIYQADLVVEGKVLVELKAVRELNEIFMAQCTNYLKATRMRLCLLVNFGKPKVEIKRIVL